MNAAYVTRLIFVVLIFSMGMCAIKEQSCTRPNTLENRRTTAEVLTFIRGDFPEGIPPEKAKEFGISTLPTLLSSLTRPELEAYHANIITILGIMADSRALLPVISYVETTKGEISLERFEAVLSSPLAIGHIASTNDLALRYLLERSEPSAWANRPWNFGNLGSLQNIFMARAVLNGLGVSGRDEALRRLEQLRDASEVLKGSAEDNIRLNRQIAKNRLSSAVVEEKKISCEETSLVNSFSAPLERASDAKSLVVQPLTVARHVNTSVLVDEPKRAMAEASSDLQISRRRSDFECPVMLELKDDRLDEFGNNRDGNSVIQYRTQLIDVLCDKTARVKIVTTISGYNLCDTQGEGRFAGCAEEPGKNILIKTFHGDIWAHEFGHNQGLQHRDDGEGHAIMHSTAESTDEVDETECTKFEKGGIPRSR